MILELHQLTAGTYLLAALAAVLGLAVPAPRWDRAAVALLAFGWLLHTLALIPVHAADPPPSLRELPMVVSLVAWIGTLFYLLLLLRVRGAGLVVLVAPLAFFGVFFQSLGLPVPAPGPEVSPLWSHLHILLASAGFALLGVAGAAGLLYVVHHRAIKAKRPGPLRLPLPSLEALDRVNVLALFIGFLLLSLGVLSGIAWVQVVEKQFWPGDLHANVTGLAWLVYAILVGVRLADRVGARQSAVSSAAGFVFLLFAVVGVGILT